MHALETGLTILLATAWTLLIAGVVLAVIAMIN